MRRCQGELPAGVGFEPGWRPRKWFQLMDREWEKVSQKRHQQAKLRGGLGSDLGGQGQEQPGLKVLLGPRPGQWVGASCPLPSPGWVRMGCVAGVLRGGWQLCGRTGCPKDGCLLPQEWRREPGKLNFVIPCLLGKTCMIKNQNHTVKFIKAQIPNHHKVF